MLYLQWDKEIIEWEPHSVPTMKRGNDWMGAPMLCVWWNNNNILRKFNGSPIWCTCNERHIFHADAYVFRTPGDISKFQDAPLAFIPHLLPCLTCFHAPLAPIPPLASMPHIISKCWADSLGVNAPLAFMTHLLPCLTCFHAPLASMPHLLPCPTCFHAPLASIPHLLPFPTCFHASLYSMPHLLPCPTCFHAPLASMPHLQVSMPHAHYIEMFTHLVSMLPMPLSRSVCPRIWSRPQRTPAGLSRPARARWSRPVCS